ncbi:hypothetical protein OOZ63_27285 [Paucibacter sp. PLA-PC-4]|uniref:hypothetical protein n=1 Tax=Paucibacter sp. PLA-PC-4 TaxID=2993655 RepID=UPI00224A4E09|nr:hypothetical protein [Paucibacter sp. PLA-PC-4]MCX2865531.1 hypothetical protein [Paucibacter sp. PLA-PC-4]
MNSEKDADLKLSPDEHSLLAQVLDQMEELGGPVPALKFRVARREQLQMLNDLEAERWLKRDNDRYTILSILLPLVDSESARRQLANIELVYAVLREKYFESQQNPVKVVDIAAATGLPNEQALGILKLMADCTLWNAGWSLDVSIGDAYVNPAEKLIEFESYASMVKEVRSWWIWPVEERNAFVKAADQPLAAEGVNSSGATTQTLSQQVLPRLRTSMATGGARTEQQINNAIGLLMAQVDALTAKSVDWEMRTDDVRLKVLISSFHNAVREAFGIDSPEFREYGHIEMLAGPLRVGMSVDDLYHARAKGRDYIVAVCGELIQRLQRKLRTPPVSGEGSTSTWHPKIAKAVADLLANGPPASKYLSPR